MKKIYFISGLGADERSFGFMDLSFCEAHFIAWVKPDSSDTMATYSEKLFACIDDENATIVGMSFGGMLATEIAKKHPATKVIIIASSKTHKEIPGYLRVWRYFPIYKLHTDRWKNYSGRFVLSILGAKGIEPKRVQNEILKDSDSAFVRWAMGAIVNWKNKVVPPNVVHIHGTSDKLLPYRFVKADHVINKGEHLMMMDNADELSALLKKLIAD